MRPFQSKVQNGNFLVRMIYNIAYAKKLALLKKGVTTRESFWDRLVFNRIQVSFNVSANM